MKVMVTVDSLHVKGLIDQKCIARGNKTIALLLCHLWKMVKDKVSITIRWARGHSGDAVSAEDKNSSVGKIDEDGKKLRR